MLRGLIKEVASRAGFYVLDKTSVPWGVDKYVDLSALAVGRVETIFDVGANIGQTVEELSSVIDYGSIHAFEPVPASYAQLQAVAARHANVHCHNVALGSQPGAVQMHAMGSAGTNSLLAASGADSIDVPVETVDAFAEKHGINSIDLLKIDTEGYEVEVLLGASAMLSQGKVRFVLAECEFTLRPNEPHGDFFKIAELMLGHGYRLVATYTEGIDTATGWRWGDVLFTRPGTDSRLRRSPFGLPIEA